MNRTSVSIIGFLFLISLVEGIVLESCWVLMISVKQWTDQSACIIYWRVWRYQRGNHNPYIEEQPIATQWPNRGHAIECFLPSFSSFGQAVSEEKIFLKSANQKQELPMVAMFVNGSGQNEQSLERTFHSLCFLPSFTSFGWGVSEEKIRMWKVNGRQTTDDGRRTPSDGKSSPCQGKVS